MKNNKTNALRILDSKKINYKTYDYSDSGMISGVDVADVLGEDYSTVFKTLVTIGKSGNHYVFLVPSDKELNLKLAASVVGEKNIEMIKSRELLDLTGYIHGGCSPIGMKKFFTTTIDISALDHKRIFFSAGRIGLQVEMNVCDIEKVIKVNYEKIV